MRKPAITKIVWLAALVAAATAAQDYGHGELKLDTGRVIWEKTCATCHGADGKGSVRTSVGFTARLPDFTDCSFATKEPDGDWSATIHNGGPARGFSEIMPSFREALSDEQIDRVIGYMRGFCKEKSWPQGDLNLPRPMITEKAFPENEVVITSAFNAHGAPGVANVMTIERRIGARTQLETAIPYNFTHNNAPWSSAFGDISLALKQNVFHSAGSILSLFGEVTAPVGNRALGTGGASTVFEMSAAYGQILPADTFLQFHTGVELPVHPDAVSKAYFARTAIGKSWSAGGGFGRTWTPMMEFIADHDFYTGTKTNWDFIPQMQIPLSKRMHILGSIGFRIPANNTVNRPKQLMFYLLWDYGDGSLREGW